ncbi:hypothetical protein HanXRQr2_Chr09g0385911 [Helianthus annuus]|uniref:Uncharacterized protein n=1 Tax=Helianthus annuus TaxID=4232 RepID=A0A251TY45_HELAN|nr:hypothetical protein HanXRQr2_Chr09g0385911 [Helianthus annuus]KAJ0525866.1 hypothetical protein HanHA300_Chr09g0316881 [Helianthus annuus]KAJ0707306.1 hypothetical protein HanLR1_Chr09g0317021 [Helianthus annuus]KAJ0711319.1 hypothetical protein HanOQP8_Chr09g0322521 [Helianthus annuus]
MHRQTLEPLLLSLFSLPKKRSMKQLNPSRTTIALALATPAIRFVLFHMTSDG